MDNILIRYFNQRYGEKDVTENQPKGKGPVITISRMAGCPAGLIAEGLHRRLRDAKIGPQPGNWRIISKEILSESARELGLSENKIRYVFEAGARSTMDEIIEALSSRYYKSDLKIRKTIVEVIRTIASQGSVIIIGRGGVAITRNIPSSLHIRLEAPAEWRMEKLMKKNGWDKETATRTMNDWDERRSKLLEEFAGVTNTEAYFDATFNCSRLEREKIVESIIKLLP